MKSLILIALVLSAYSITIDQTIISSSEQQLLQEVQQTTWGKIILSMVEVSTSTEGILQTLIDSIGDLIKELADNLAQLEKDYDRTQSVYNTKRDQLQLQGEDASRDISNASDMINNVLFPTRDRFNAKLKQVGINIKENRQSLDEETVKRNRAHADFVERMNEHQDALSGVDECISLLQGISNTGSLAQVTRLSNSIAALEQKISKKETLGPLIKVIMELTSQQNFSDQSLVKEIINQFNQLRVSLVDSLNQEAEDENESAKQFVDRSRNLNTEYTEFQRQVKEATYQIAAIETKLDSYTAFLKQRQSDLGDIKAQQSELENWYAGETTIYNDLKSQYQREKDASEKALSLVSAPDFVNYIKSKGGL